MKTAHLISAFEKILRRQAYWVYLRKMYNLIGYEPKSVRSELVDIVSPILLDPIEELVRWAVY